MQSSKLCGRQKQQRTAWEAEFSFCAHPAVILPPGGVSKRQRNRVSGSNENNDRNEPKRLTDLGVSSFSSGVANLEESQHTRHQQQQRIFCQDEGPEEPHTQNQMGSAKFLFTCDPAALEHRSKPSSSNGFGGRDTRRDSARWGGKNDRSIARWGNERAVLKGLFSPYKLEVDGTPQQQQHELYRGRGFCEKASSATSTTADRPRRCTLVMGAATNNRHIVTPTTTAGAALVTREGVLRRSTWLGPEVSPLPVRSEQEAARLNSPSPFAVKFAAAAWPSPKQNGRWRGLKSGIKSYRRPHGGISRGDPPERGVRPQRGRGSFQQQYSTCRSSRAETIPPRGNSGAQVRCLRRLFTPLRTRVLENCRVSRGECSLSDDPL